jgi:hypothetical protein
MSSSSPSLFEHSPIAFAKWEDPGSMCFRPSSFWLATSSKSRYRAPGICLCLYSSRALRGEPGMCQLASRKTVFCTPPLTSFGDTSSGVVDVVADILLADSLAKDPVGLTIVRARDNIVLLQSARVTSQVKVSRFPRPSPCGCRRHTCSLSKLCHRSLRRMSIQTLNHT